MYMPATMSETQPGPSTAPLQHTTMTAMSPKDLSPRQREKARAVPLDQVELDEGHVEHDLSLLISQYLHERPHGDLARAFDQEVLGLGRDKQKQEDMEEVERALLDGEFGTLEGLISRPGLVRPQSQRAFLYLCYRQQFLEYIENRESQKAFNLLQKRLKPLEHYQPVPYDFYNLCYLTSAGTVHDAPGLKDWGGVGPEREKLVSMWRELAGSMPLDDGTDGVQNVPPGRLMLLMRQAAAWQVSHAKHRGERPYIVRTLLHDYALSSVPDTMRLRVKGHAANIKCVGFIGTDEPVYAVSGSSDSTLRIFSTMDGSVKHVLIGHRSRVWDCAVSSSGHILASASGDGTVRIWSADQGQCENVLVGDNGDVYGVRWRPHREDQIVSASYDRIVRCWDVETGNLLRTFSGHSQSTLSVAYDHTGNLLASGSRDRNVRLWDAIGGTCVKSLSGSLGEITSVEFDNDGKYLLAGCKDNSNRLWDLRMHRVLYRYTGHQNTSKNLIRCSFGGHDSSLIISGSEDGNVYVWDREPTGSNALGKSGNLSSAALLPSGFTPTASPSALRGPGGEINASANRSSPAYYPPRDFKPAVTAHGGSGANVRPTKVLKGHGRGAVFDARWRDGEIVSAGEDETVGIWYAREED